MAHLCLIKFLVHPFIAAVIELLHPRVTRRLRELESINLATNAADDLHYPITSRLFSFLLRLHASHRIFMASHDARGVRARHLRQVCISGDTMPLLLATKPFVSFSFSMSSKPQTQPKRTEEGCSGHVATRAEMVIPAQSYWEYSVDTSDPGSMPGTPAAPRERDPRQWFVSSKST